jgi:hypothetical protein
MRVEQVRTVGEGAGTRGWFAPRALLLALTVLVYLPSLGTAYVWDDDDYLINKPTLLAPRAFFRIWTEPQASSKYYPLVFSTTWVKYHLWGLLGLSRAFRPITLNGWRLSTQFARVSRLEPGVPRRRCRGRRGHSHQ